MKLMIQIKVPLEEAHKFVTRMGEQGYDAVPVQRVPDITDVHFIIGGEVSCDYSVTMLDDYAFIGIRPQ